MIGDDRSELASRAPLRHLGGMEGQSHLGLGVAIGVGIGAVLGIVIGNVPIGMVAGIALGAAVGYALDRRSRG